MITEIPALLKAQDLPGYIGEDVNVFMYPRRQAYELLTDPGLQDYWETWGPAYGLERAFILDGGLFS